MRQRIADALQVVGAAAFVVAGSTISVTAAWFTAGAVLIMAGVVMERS